MNVNNTQNHDKNNFNEQKPSPKLSRLLILAVIAAIVIVLLILQGFSGKEENSNTKSDWFTVNRRDLTISVI